MRRFPKRLLLLLIAVAFITTDVSVALAAVAKKSGAVGRKSSASSGSLVNSIGANMGSFTSPAELELKKKPVVNGSAGTATGFGRPLKAKRPATMIPLTSR